MGEINCKDCEMKNTKFINELCSEACVEILDEENKVYVDKAGNKSKIMLKFNSKNENKNSEFSGDNKKIATEDQELLSKINHNCEKVNDESLEDYSHKKIFSNSDVILNCTVEKNSEAGCPSKDGRYIDPYGQNYQDYDLQSSESQKAISQNQNYGSYISYKNI